ncbi:ABC transporter substrate-binding protein [Prosthecomicrobium hirschii]|uniref:ABC transporter substrate-binding protein n=1 Tax=Prosthecodimorpha hirschii TaxID=665126 RepID=A0A0P6WIB7_9HYPH|nr:ABC transporter substrate-binding protein [Prosthecomicrobium hirschii]
MITEDGARRLSSRRSFLRTASAAALAVPAARVAAWAAPPGKIADPAAALLEQSIICRTAGPGGGPLLAGPPRKLRFSWNATAVCLAPAAVAVEKGFFAAHNLDVDLINFGGSTDQLLEAIATGKSDAGIGMALRWLKPMEQGFDVKITAGTHGGCMRLLALNDGKIRSLKDLKGKSIAVADLAAPGKNFFSILLQKEGLDPDKDVEWRQFPGELLRAALEKGEAQALVDGDPKTYLWLKDGKLAEVSSNLHGEFANRVCCILGVRGSLIREDPIVAKALTLALLDAAHYTVQNPAEVAKIFLPYAPNASLADLEALLRYHTHHHNPVGAALKREIALYADELKLVNVFKRTTDPARFANRVFADVLSV